jgi:uncharacterized damage-inducible protein DinB
MPSEIGPVCRLHLEFMQWADDTVLAALSQAPPDRVGHDLGSSFKSILGTLNHVYLAEWVWLRRVQGQPGARIADIESPADLGALGQAWPALHQMWIDWSRALSSEDWQKPLLNRNPQGVEFKLPHWQIVLHLVNHGSYHRGQVATMLRQSGIVPPGTDLVTFYRARQGS